MKTYSLAFALILVVGLLALALGPYEGLLIASLLVGFTFRARYPVGSFVAGFLAGAALWGVGALWYGGQAGSLPGMIAELFGVGSALGLGLLVGVAGGLSAGLFALLGAYLRVSVQGWPAGS